MPRRHERRGGFLCHRHIAQQRRENPDVNVQFWLPVTKEASVSDISTEYTLRSGDGRQEENAPSFLEDGGECLLLSSRSTIMHDCLREDPMR